MNAQLATVAELLEQVDGHIEGIQVELTDSSTEPPEPTDSTVPDGSTQPTL